MLCVRVCVVVRAVVAVVVVVVSRGRRLGQGQSPSCRRRCKAGETGRRWTKVQSPDPLTTRQLVPTRYRPRAPCTLELEPHGPLVCWVRVANQARHCSDDSTCFLSRRGHGLCTHLHADALYRECLLISNKPPRLKMSSRGPEYLFSYY